MFQKIRCFSSGDPHPSCVWTRFRSILSKLVSGSASKKFIACDLPSNQIIPSISFALRKSFLNPATRNKTTHSGQDFAWSIETQKNFKCCVYACCCNSHVKSFCGLMVDDEMRWFVVTLFKENSNTSSSLHFRINFTLKITQTKQSDNQQYLYLLKYLLNFYTLWLPHEEVRKVL